MPKLSVGFSVQSAGDGHQSSHASRDHGPLQTEQDTHADYFCLQAEDRQGFSSGQGLGAQIRAAVQSVHRNAPKMIILSDCRLKIGRGPLLGKALEFFSDQGSHAVRGQRSLLEAWTSAIEMDVLSSGALVNRRMDLLVGSFSRGASIVSIPSVLPEATWRYSSSAPARLVFAAACNSACAFYLM